MTRFWFGEGPALGWIAFRLLFAGALLLELPTSQLKNLHAISNELFHLPYLSWLPPISPSAYDWLHWLQYPLILLLGFGLWTRASALLLLVMQSWIFFSDALNYRNHPYFFLLLLAALALQPGGPSLIGGSWSEWAQRRVPWCWPRMVQLQLSLCYLFAALHKLHPGYLSGKVLADLRPGTPALAAWGVVVIELGLAVGLWIPRLRLGAVGVGLLFHLVLALLLEVHAFSLAIIAIYALFATEHFFTTNKEA
jgi:hypothetical protein